MKAGASLAYLPGLVSLCLPGTVLAAGSLTDVVPPPVPQPQPSQFTQDTAPAGANQGGTPASSPPQPAPEGSPAAPPPADYGGTGPLRYIDIYGIPGVGKVQPPAESAPAQPAATTEAPAAPTTQAPAAQPPAGVEPRTKAKAKKAPKKTGQKKKTAAAKKPRPPEEPPSPPVPADPLRDAMLLMAARRYDQAYAEVTKVLAREPANVEALYLKAVAEVHLRRYAEASNDYQAVLRLAPASPLAERARQGLKMLKAPGAGAEAPPAPVR